MALLLMFLLVGDLVVVARQQGLLMDREQKHAVDEVQLLSSVFLEALIRHDYMTVKSTVEDLSPTHARIVSLNVTAPNGFLIGNYVRPDAPKGETFKYEKNIALEGRSYARISMTGDYVEIRPVVARLNRTLLVFSAAFAAAFGAALWFAMNRFAIEPLTLEIETRKKAEQQIEAAGRRLASANRELESFAYSVSHDLRSPLRGIDGFSQALVEDCSSGLSPECQGYVQRIRAGCRRMDALIADILKLSRINRSEINLGRTDLSAMAREAVEELRRQNPGRKVDVSIEDAMYAIADAGLVRQVIENLIGNAWKFTSKTEGARIEVGARPSPHGVREFFVRDNGAGFNMAYADKLFNAFQRLHAENEFEGSGIGLATVQRIVARHGGYVMAEGAPGGGAEFRFTLDAGKAGTDER